MKKLMLLAVLAVATASLSGCNGTRGMRSWQPSWCQSNSCSTATAYDPATPYVDGGYMVPPASVNELPAPGPVTIN